MKQPLYRIQVVTQRTGIPSATLRAWERRYGFPKPTRSDSSTYRLYSEQDIEDILSIKSLCEEGISPSEAVNLQVIKKTQVAESSSTPLSSDESSEPMLDSAQLALYRILDATRKFDHTALERAVREAVLLGSAKRVFEEVFAPALREIGEEWHQGSLSIGQEHLATELIESATRDMLRVVQPDEGPSILLACVQDELHVLPLFGSAFHFAQWGYRVTMLGANTPPHALAETVKALNPHAIGLSITQKHTQMAELLPLYAEACGGRPWVTGGFSVGVYQSQIESLGGMIVTSDLSAVRTYLDSRTRD